MSSNRDIQASHQIINLFERAKSHTEITLDTIPGIFCVIGLSGEIYRGNVVLAELMGTEQEFLLGQSFHKLFSEAQWHQFRQKLELLSDQSSPAEDFELSLDFFSPARSYVWHILPLKLGTNENVRLITVIGRDVTELKNTISENARMEVELLTTSAVQKLFLPEVSVVRIPSLQLEGFYRPAAQCGGDWWWYRLDDDNHVSGFIGDVTGHGAHAAMITATVATSFKAFEKQGPKGSLPDLVQSVHDVLFDIVKGNYYMPALAFEFDGTTRVLKCWSAGAPTIFAFRNGQKAERVNGGPGTPLGLYRKFALNEFTLQLNCGDRVFICTDGITEQEMREGQEFGERQFMKLLESAKGLEAGKVIEHIMLEFDKQRKNMIQGDDITLIMLEIL